MKLLRRILYTLSTVVIAGAFAAGGAMAEPDAPRSCTTERGYDINVDIETDSVSTTFMYEIDAHGDNPDHAVLAMDCLELCEADGQ